LDQLRTGIARQNNEIVAVIEPVSPWPSALAHQADETPYRTSADNIRQQWRDHSALRRTGGVKIAQFPNGTVFDLGTKNPGNAYRKAWLDEARKIVERAGMSIR